MNFRLAYKPRARLQTVNQLGQRNGARKQGLRSNKTPGETESAMKSAQQIRKLFFGEAGFPD